MKTAEPSRADFHAAVASGSKRWYAACLRITRDGPMAEDAVQDALLNAWQKRHQFGGAARLDTWIHRIAVNSALQLLRRKKPEFSDALLVDPEDPATNPETAQMDHELSTDLVGKLKVLSDMERVCFTLKHLEEWRLQEIAAELDISVGRTKQALFRAVRKLRVSMTELHEAEAGGGR